MRFIFIPLIAVFCFTTYGQGTFSIGSGAQIKSSGGIYVVLDNMHLLNNGTIQQNSGDGVFKFTNGGDVIISGTGAIVLSKIHLNKSVNSSVLLQCNVTVLDEIRFTSGLLNLGNRVLDLGNTGVLTTESETSHAYSNGTGYLQANASLNGPQAVNPGNLGAVITSPQNLGPTVVRRGHNAQSSLGDAGHSILRYYDIVPTNNTALNATIRMYYLDAELNNLNESFLQLFRSEDNIVWTNQGFSTRPLRAVN